MPTLSDIKRIALESCAIYISDDFIDIVKGDITPIGRLRVRSLTRFPLLKNIKNMPYENAEEEIDRVLAKAFEKKEDMPYRAAINLRNEFFILRRFAFREIPDNELRKAVVFESQKYTHLPIEDLAFAFQKCSKTDGLQEIIFVASETKNIQGVVSYFSRHNILPSMITPTPVLISQALRLEGGMKKGGAYISIHYEPANKVMITGIWHGQAHFFKEINTFPGEEEFKTAELSYPTLKDTWPMIENDIYSSIEYLRKETKRNIEKVFISGFSRSREEDDISKELMIPLERPNRFSCFRYHAADDSDRFIPALSLICNTVSPSSLNLAPDNIKYRDPWTFKPVAVRAVLLFMGILLFHIIFSIVNTAQAVNIAELRKNVESYKIVGPDASRDDVLRYKTVMEDKAAFIHGLVSERISLAEKLNELPKNTSQNTWIDSISFRDSIGKNRDASLKIAGGVYLPQGGDNAEVNDMLTRMERDPKMVQGFKNIELASVKNKKLLDKEIAEFEILLK